MGALPSRLVPRGPKADDRLVQGFEDRNLEPYEVVLSRSEYEAWGLAWNVRAHAAKRLQVAGVDPCSPAGRWNQGQQAAGLRGIRRGDELFEVNGYSGHSGMREQLSASRAARLLFRPDSQDLAIPKLHPMESKIGPDSVKNTFIHYGNSRDDADTTDDIQPRRLSLSDPLPLSSLPMQLEDDRLSEASFYSVDSCASSLSRSSGSQNQPSSGRSCPSTDWEFQGYQCRDGQMLPPFARSGSSEQASSSSGRGKRRRRASAPAWQLAPMPVQPAQPIQPVPPCPMPNQMQNSLPSQVPFPPTMVPVMVPLVGAPPGQHFLAMASMAPMAPIAPMPSVGVAVPFPNAPMASETEVPCQSFDRQEVSLEPQEVDPGVEKVSDLSNQGNQGDRGQGGQGDQGGQGGQGEGDQSSQPLLGAQMACQREEFPKLRKKPTRRGGKRARHRPCHAAGAAMEWASSVGSAETPSFGEPGSGEEAEGEDELDGPDPKALDSVPVSKPRSFYPLAARLRVASAGQKPKGADEPNAIAEGSKGKPKESGCDEVEWAIKEPEEWPVRRIEAIEEVEPEPASASDVSDLPQREPARKGTPEACPEPHPRVTDLDSEQVIGRRVQITGLTKTPEFNGQWGKVTHFDATCERYSVQLLPAEGIPMIVKLRGENLHMPAVLSLRFEESQEKDTWQPALRAVKTAACRLLQ
ncbi:unnamed protein product [Effrenium voratum]|nr:unnamed protein product [Effrenium voratum]